MSKCKKRQDWQSCPAMEPCVTHSCTRNSCYCSGKESSLGAKAHKKQRAPKAGSLVAAERDALKAQLEAVYTAVGLVGDDRCLDGVKGVMIVNRNAIRLQKERADTLRAAMKLEGQKATDTPDDVYVRNLMATAHNVLAWDPRKGAPNWERFYRKLDVLGQALTALEEDRRTRGIIAAQGTERDEKLRAGLKCCRCGKPPTRLGDHHYRLTNEYDASNKALLDVLSLKGDPCCDQCCGHGKKDPRCAPLP